MAQLFPGGRRPLPPPLRPNTDRSRTPDRSPQTKRRKPNAAPTPARAQSPNTPGPDDLDPRDFETLREQLRSERDGRERCERSTPNRLVAVLTPLRLYGFRAMIDIKRTRGKSRNCLVGDIRREDGTSFAKTRLILAISTELYRRASGF